MPDTPITKDDARLTAYAVGEMGVKDREQFERLLADSPDAKAEVEAIRQLGEELSREFERELEAMGQQPLVALPSPQAGRTAETPGESNVVRPKFWAVGSIAAGLAATVMVAVYVSDQPGMVEYVPAGGPASEEGTELNSAGDKVRGMGAAMADEVPGGSTNLAPSPADADATAAVADASAAALGGGGAGAAQEALAVAPPAPTAPAAAAMVAADGAAEENRGRDRGAEVARERQDAVPAEKKRVGGTEGDVPEGGERLLQATPGNRSSVEVPAAEEAAARPEMAGMAGARAAAPPEADAVPAPQADATGGMALAQPEPAAGPSAVHSVGSGSGAQPKAAPRRAMDFTEEREATFGVDAANLDGLVPESRNGMRDHREPRDHVDRSVVVVPRAGGDRYSRLIDNPFKDPLDEALSTFSIDVDTASYTQLRRRLLAEGQWPHPDQVRIEELINYFDYDYPAPDFEEVEAGHEAPFAVSLEVGAAPWAPEHRLVRIGLKSAELEVERPPANLVFLVDVSGSMKSADKLPLMQKALRELVPQLGSEDSVTMVAYAGRAGEVLEPTPGDDHQTIRAAIDALTAGGSTNGAGGITLAYQRAREHFVKDGVNRVILATDGDFNVGTSGDEELVRLVERQAKSGVFLTVLGFGSGNLNDSMMEKITNKGNGNYFYIDRASEAKKVMAEQMSATLVMVAKDVKIQVDFNPGKVASYRLIGYANRMLEREDFDDDTVDAGEIGAGHTVTALYEVVPVGVALDLTGGQDLEGLRYQRRLDAAAEQDLEAQRQEQLAERGIELIESEELLTVKLRYKQPDEDESALLQFPLVDPEAVARGRRAVANPSDDFRFASAVAAFGMRLRQSDYVDEDFGFDAIAEQAAGALGKDPHGRRREFLDMIESAASLEPGAGDDVRRAVRERLEQLR